MLSERVYQLFRQSVEAKMEVGEELAPLIAQASETVVQALLNEKKVLCCGNGASAALVQIFTSAMLDRFEKERPSLPAIWLGSNVATYTAISAEKSINDVFAKPVRALGSEGDILLLASSSGNSSNLVQAITAAHDRGIHVIALTGRDGGDISSLMDVKDLELRAATGKRSRIHEIHLLTIFSLLDLIDFQLFGME
jgi:D-sedoheptulose 7-phosphate isomerase